MKRILLLAIVVSAAVAAAALAGETRMLHVYNAAPEGVAAGAVRTFITADSGSEAEIEALRQRLIHAGARNVNWFGDKVIVCELPRGIDFGPVLSSPGVAARSAADVPDYTPGSQDFVAQVKYAYDVAARLRETPDVHAGTDFKDHVNVISPDEARRIRKAVMDHPALSSGLDDITRTPNQNSEILTGSIKVYIVLPESNGRIDPNRENWHESNGDEAQDLIDARTHAFAALLDWQSQFPNMDISFRVIPLIPDCSYEPILHDMNDDYVWILDTMRALDPNLSAFHDPLVAVHAWNEANKAGYDWIYTMFIGHSRTVTTHRFGDGGADYTAYANLGGPYLVNPYPAGLDPNEIGENLVYSKVIQHESGHIFWALDEYPGAPGTCLDTSGYLDYTNENLNMTGPGGIMRCRLPEIDCIMNRAGREDVGRPYCEWSLGQMGVIDNNNNAIPDVFEARPSISFETQGADTVNTGDYTVRLTVTSQAVPNRNFRFTGEQRIDYAAPLQGAQFSVGGGWASLDAADGRWDEAVEETSLRLNGLPPGATTIRFQARSSMNMSSGVYVKTVYFLGIHFRHLSVGARESENRIAWEVVGENYGARFDVYRLDPGEPMPDLAEVRPGEELPGTLVATDVRPSGTGSNGFVPYAALDRNVTPGSQYRYYVNAVGEVEFQGTPRTFYSPSKLVAQIAMLPVPKGRLVSNVSPNPFRNEVALSIKVPQTFVQGATYEQRVATPVDVTVYDVLGRAVQTLYTGGSFQDVVTLKWDGMLSNGNAATSGVYFVRVKAGPASAVEKVLLVR